MKRFALIVGTRPNFVKAAAVERALCARGAEVLLVHTGQHFDPALSHSFFAQLALPAPAHHLGVSAGSRGEQFGAIVRGLAALLPTLGVAEVIVVGDVTSTAAGAVAADACDLPLCHVEAGLRSRDPSMPEERNRRVTDVLASRWFASEPSGVANLEAEGVAPGRVHLVGNVMIDTLLRFRDAALAGAPWRAHGLERGGYAVATLHRPGNVDAREPLAESLAVLGEAGRRWPVLFASHPRTQARLREFGLAVPDGVRLMPPAEYLDFIGLMAGARVVLTDSGGAQEETTALDVPCLTMRENTERPITCELGSARLIGRDVARARPLLDDIAAGRYPPARAVPLWDGKAGERIAAILVEGA